MKKPPPNHAPLRLAVAFDLRLDAVSKKLGLFLRRQSR